MRLEPQVRCWATDAEIEGSLATAFAEERKLTYTFAHSRGVGVCPIGKSSIYTLGRRVSHPAATLPSYVVGFDFARCVAATHAGTLYKLVARGNAAEKLRNPWSSNADGPPRLSPLLFCTIGRLERADDSVVLP